MRGKTDKHDVVILGSGLGGLIAGALLAKRRFDVLLLKERRYGRSLVREGYRFIPFSNFSEVCVSHSLLAVLSRTLNLPLLNGEGVETEPMGKGLRKRRRDLAFQVILPRARIDVLPDRALLQREWRREFPKEKEATEHFYRVLEGVRPLYRRMVVEKDARGVFPIRCPARIKRWLPFSSVSSDPLSQRLSGFSNEFKEFVKLQLISWGSLCSDELPLYLVAHLLLQRDEETWISPINLDGIEQKILGLFTLSGGEVEEIEGVEKIEKKWWRGFEISLSEEARVVASRFLILNCPLHRHSDFFAKRDGGVSKWRGRIQPRYALLPLFVGLNEKVVPVGMRDLLVSVRDLEKPYEGGNLLFLRLSPKGDQRWAPEGKRALAVVSLLSMKEWDRISLDEHMKEVMRHLYHLFPFLEAHIEFSDWSWTREKWPSWSYPHFLYETNHHAKWSKGIIPNRLSRDLYFIGKENFPYLGLEGEVLGARLVAGQISERLKP